MQDEWSYDLRGTHMAHLGYTEHEEATVLWFLALRLVCRVDIALLNIDYLSVRRRLHLRIRETPTGRLVAPGDALLLLVTGLVMNK